MGRPLGSVNLKPSDPDLQDLASILSSPPPSHPDPVLPPPDALQSPFTPTDLVSYAVAIKRAGIHKHTLRKWMRAGIVKRYGRHKALRVSMSEVMPLIPNQPKLIVLPKCDAVATTGVV